MDYETYSSVDLTKSNVYRYTESTDFRVLMCAWSVDGSPAQVITDQDENADRLRYHLDQGDLLVAHNAQFERIVSSRLLGMPTGSYLDPELFHDTAAIAAEHGYPTSLERLAVTLGATPKDSAGTRLINIFSKPNRKGERTLPDAKPDEWIDFISYCAQDVDTLVEIDDLLGDWPTEMERQIYLSDQRINDHGIRIDTQLAKYAVEAALDNRMEQELRVMHLTGIANPGSQPQFLKWCQLAISPRVRNLQATTIERILVSPKLAPVQREILEIRQELALVASKKFESALKAVSPDSRLRGTLKFFGAHTGRWSGKGTQVQNLPREAFTYTDSSGKEHHDHDAEESAILDLLLGLGASSLDLKKLVRAMFYIDGCVVDYSSIEARVLAWLAPEQWALDAFGEGRDIYVETAERMSTPGHKLTRAQGKVAVLALGYNGGINSLRVMGAEGSDDDLQRLVTQWRKANPAIVRLWSLMGDAIGESETGPEQIGPHLRMSRDGDTVRLHLPSGRAITYHGMRWERYKVKDLKTGRWLRKEGWRYDDPKKVGMRIGTYGGRMVENATQAVARDIMGEALVRLHQQGHTVVGHVHDEILVEGDHPVEEISHIMCQLPGWAKGLPIDGEGFTTGRYAKG